VHWEVVQPQHNRLVVGHHQTGVCGMSQLRDILQLQGLLEVWLLMRVCFWPACFLLVSCVLMRCVVFACLFHGWQQLCEGARARMRLQPFLGSHSILC
jgi:hypothetical protein